MNDIRRTILLVIFGFSLVMLWDQWQVHNGNKPTFLPSAKTAASAPGSGALAGAASGAAGGVPAVVPVMLGSIRQLPQQGMLPLLTDPEMYVVPSPDDQQHIVRSRSATGTL